MTGKAALAGLHHGGGKTVAALDEDFARRNSATDRADLLADIGDLVESFGGRYVTGPDIGSGPEDMTRIGERTAHVLCRPASAGGSGDSSGPTALGVTASIDAACAHAWPGKDLSDLRFAVHGLGHVGTQVAAHLATRGARLVVADVDQSRRALAQDWGATGTTPNKLKVAATRVRGIGQRLTRILSAADAAGTTPLLEARRILHSILHEAEPTAGVTRPAATATRHRRGA